MMVPIFWPSKPQPGLLRLSKLRGSIHTMEFAAGARECSCVAASLLARLLLYFHCKHRASQLSRLVQFVSSATIERIISPDGLERAVALGSDHASETELARLGSAPVGVAHRTQLAGQA